MHTVCSGEEGNGSSVAGRSHEFMNLFSELLEDCRDGIAYRSCCRWAFLVKKLVGTEAVKGCKLILIVVERCSLHPFSDSRNRLDQRSRRSQGRQEGMENQHGEHYGSGSSNRVASDVAGEEVVDPEKVRMLMKCPTECHVTCHMCCELREGFVRDRGEGRVSEKSRDWVKTLDVTEVKVGCLGKVGIVYGGLGM
ncbi:unnamed protein product [Lactuca saligna]|uniref:Uncharacterized protein n=1 Tax=Lactuca saligna TaxID=75948 RepID=A0AA35V3D2_LACSI|nr:unnamed protein product [Lactuca saligna]